MSTYCLWLNYFLQTFLELLLYQNTRSWDRSEGYFSWEICDVVMFIVEEYDAFLTWREIVIILQELINQVLNEWRNEWIAILMTVSLSDWRNACLSGWPTDSRTNLTPRLLVYVTGISYLWLCLFFVFFCLINIVFIYTKTVFLAKWINCWISELWLAGRVT